MIDSESGLRIVAGEQVAHVARDARQAFQARFAVEEVGDLARAHAALREEIEHDARVELARRALVDAKTALKGDSASDRLVAAARIDQALLAL